MGDRTTDAVCEEAHLDKELNPKDMTREQFLELHKAFKKVKIMAPSTDCLSPIGASELEKSLKREYPNAEFVTCITREPVVYRGFPFLIEVGIVYGFQEEKEPSDGGEYPANSRILDTLTD
jgi:DNA topoisomerase-6 subunit B